MSDYDEYDRGFGHGEDEKSQEHDLVMRQILTKLDEIKKANNFTSWPKGGKELIEYIRSEIWNGCSVTNEEYDNFVKWVKKNPVEERVDSLPSLNRFRWSARKG